MSDKGEVVNLAELIRSLGIQRNTLLAMVRRGCPYISKPPRTKGSKWEFNSAEVHQWRIDLAVKEAIGDVRETEILTSSSARSQTHRSRSGPD